MSIIIRKQASEKKISFDILFSFKHFLHSLDRWIPLFARRIFCYRHAIIHTGKRQRSMWKIFGVTPTKGNITLFQWKLNSQNLIISTSPTVELKNLNFGHLLLSCFRLLRFFFFCEHFKRYYVVSWEVSFLNFQQSLPLAKCNQCWSMLRQHHEIKPCTFHKYGNLPKKI